MKLAARFQCHRKGHKPSFTIRCSVPSILKTYITSCQRCGKVYESYDEQGLRPRMDGQTRPNRWS